MKRSLTDYVSDNIGRNSSYFPYGGVPDRRVTPSSINNFISKVQFQRLSHDIRMWRESIREAELAYYPQRVSMIRMFIDTVLNPDVQSTFEKWEELTLQRDFQIYQNIGGERVVSKDLSQQIQELDWFKIYVKLVLHAEAYGFTLINLGNIINDGFPEISFTPREHIIPDGINGDGKPILTSLTYAINGIDIKNHPLIDMCNHYISTPSQTGSSKCGYGLLYPTAFCEIHLRHIMEWNMDYLERYGMPIKKGTTKKTGKDRKSFIEFLANSASDSWVLLDPATGDDINYEWSQSVGTAWKSYDNVETRLIGKVNRLWLGHEDAMKGGQGKLGGEQLSNKNGHESIIEQALNAKRIRYGNFVTGKINEVFAPRMRQLGRYVGSKHIAGLIPQGYFLGLQNDSEEQQTRKRKDDNLIKTSTWVKNLNDAGYNVDAKELEKYTGFTLKEAPPERTLYEEIKTQSQITKTDTNNE